MNPPALQLSALCLCSKWGFNDGDCPEELEGYWEEIGVQWYDIDWHAALRKLVRSHLVPAMEAAGHTVEVYDIDTIHNPVRAGRIDGVEVDDYALDPGVELRVEAVEVPYAAIAEACGLQPA